MREKKERNGVEDRRRNDRGWVEAPEDFVGQQDF